MSLAAKVGIGFQDKTTSANYAITVSDNLDYEISFWFQQPTRQPTFELSLRTFNCDLSAEFKPIDIVSGAPRNLMVTALTKICSLENRWNFYHGVLYKHTQPRVSEQQALTSHAAGTNLIMAAGTAKLFVNLICVRNCLQVWDFKVKPLRTPFSTGFLGANGLLEIFRKNNRRDFTSNQIDLIAGQYLLPYNLPTSVINL